MTQEQYQRALTINEELEGLNAAKKELMYNKHRLSYQTYHSDTYSSSHWDTWTEWKMDGIRKILNRHDEMIRKEIEDEIDKRNRGIINGISKNLPHSCLSSSTTKMSVWS